MSTSIVIVSPMARPAITLNAPRGSTAVAHTAHTRKNVRIASKTTAFPSVTCDAGIGIAPFRTANWLVR